MFNDAVSYRGTHYEWALMGYDLNTVVGLEVWIPDLGISSIAAVMTDARPGQVCVQTDGELPIGAAVRIDSGRFQELGLIQSVEPLVTGGYAVTIRTLVPPGTDPKHPA